MKLSTFLIKYNKFSVCCEILGQPWDFVGHYSYYKDNNYFYIDEIFIHNNSYYICNLGDMHPIPKILIKDKKLIEKITPIIVENVRKNNKSQN